MIFLPIRHGMVCVLLTMATAQLFAQDPSRKASPDPQRSPLFEMPALAVTNGLSAEQLIQDIFIGGDCFDVSNITVSGDPTSIAKFTNGSSAVGLNEGIVLCTGTTNQILGPNNGGANGTTMSWSDVNDADLTDMTGQFFATIRDRVVLEFDFRPTKNTIQFEYVFASEEYCEYVNSTYNDVFGFFVSGPGINGGFSNNSANIARVPGSNDYITINTVNHDLNSTYYINNIPIGQVPSDNDCDGINGTTGIRTQELQFDGLTTVLTATATVQPCQTYHIRLKLADVGDGLYNSAVFLKANSFNAGGNANVELDLPMVTTPGMAYEGCSNPSLVFTRLGNNLGTPQTVNFTINPASTAVAGADYVAIPTTAIIPAGQMSVTVPVQILDDNLVEGTEKLIFNLDNFCNCSQSTVQLLINDPAPILINTPDVNLCSAQSTTISPQISGGIGNLVFSWNSGQSTQNISVTPSQSMIYELTVTDACGTTATDEVAVNVVGNPEAAVAGQFTACNGNPATVPVTFTSGGPVWDLTYSFGGNSTTLTGLTQNPYPLAINQSGTVTLTSVSSNGCPGTTFGTASVQPGGFSLTGTTAPISCFGKKDGEIKLTTVGGLAPFDFSWQNLAATTANLTNLAPGNYDATVTDANNCWEVFSTQLIDPPQITLVVGAIEGADCNDPQGGSISLTAGGGTGQLNFGWSNISQNSPNPTGLSMGNYTATATDSKGCTATVSAVVPGDFAAPTAVILPPAVLTCTDPVAEINASQSSSGPNFSIKWTTTEGNFSTAQNSLNPSVDAAGQYFLEIKNTANGCTATASTIVVADQEAPRADAGLDGEINCFSTKAALNGENSSVGQEFSYLWSPSSGGNITSGFNQNKAEADQPGSFQLLVTDVSNGCTADDFVEILDNTAPPTAASFDVFREKCAVSASWMLDFVEGGQQPYRIFIDNDELISTQELSGLAGGTHPLRIVGANGCALDTMFKVPFFTPPSVVIDPPSAKIRLGDSLILRGLPNISGAAVASYLWSPSAFLDCADCKNIQAKPFKNTVFTLILTDSAGCTASAQARIEVDESWDLFIPNAFSPNDDGQNDGLTIYANPSVVTDVEVFEIFDRWGNKVFARTHFQVSDEQLGWSGRLRDKVLDPGVFVWFARLRLLDGRQVEQKGNITLVR